MPGIESDSEIDADVEAAENRSINTGEPAQTEQVQDVDSDEDERDNGDNDNSNDDDGLVKESGDAADSIADAPSFAAPGPGGASRDTAAGSMAAVPVPVPVSVSELST